MVLGGCRSFLLLVTTFIAQHLPREREIISTKVSGIMERSCIV